jgi:hypothetical protein
MTANKYKCIIIILCFPVIFCNCATIISGTEQVVSFSSDPDGAIVRVDNNVLGKTPVVAKVKRKSNQIVTFSKESYKDASFPLNTSINPWVLINFFSCTSIGTSTDGLSGSIIEFQPNSYYAMLNNGDNKNAIDVLMPKKKKAKKYIISAYINIITELNSGRGEYVKGLFELIGVKPEDQAEALPKVKALAELYLDPPIFADKVIDYFIKGSEA